jgi:transcriptional regulator with XRE-family HTH domain
MTKLKTAIVASGYKQAWIAAKIGIDQTLLSRYVNGYRDPPPAVLKDIAKLLGVSQQSIAGGE